VYFSRDEYQDRWSRFEKELVEAGYEAALVWQRTGGSYDRAGAVFWLSGYASHASGQERLDHQNPGRSFAAMIFRPGAEPELHIAEETSTIDPRYVAVDNVVAHAQPGENLGRGVAERLAELGLSGRVAHMGEDFIPLEYNKTLASTVPDITLVPEEYMIMELQHHKSPAEIELYREAGKIAGDALTAFMEALIRGERQCDAAAAAGSIIIGAGGGFQRLGCHHGAQSELAMWDYPLYGYSREAPSPGDLVRAWVYGPILAGYWLDPGRTSVCGPKPSPEQKKLVEDTLELLLAVIAEIKPGNTPRAAGKVGDETLARLGYDYDLGGALWEIYGHGLGTAGAPGVIPAHANGQDFYKWWAVDKPFHVGQVFTAEVFVREPGLGMASFEEILIVTEDGTERLTETPLLFW
jgi:Xaa-Pro aminopeptidase